MSENLTEAQIFQDNLAVSTAILEVGAAVMKQVEGTDEVADSVNGEARTIRDYEEQIAANSLKAFGA